jgi:serine/threonine protein kinase
VLRILVCSRDVLYLESHCLFQVLVFSTTIVPASDPVVRPGRDGDEPLASVSSASSVPSSSAAVSTLSDGMPMLNVKIADFGVARYVGVSAASAGAATFVGSPQYVAPEVLFARENAGATYGRAVDV